jgi:ribosomal protein L32
VSFMFNIFKQMRCGHDWGESFILKYEAKHQQLFSDSTDGHRLIVSGHFCPKCGKYEFHQYIGIPGGRERCISIKEFHSIRKSSQQTQDNLAAKK